MASEQKKKRTTATTSKKSSAKKGQTRSVTVASTKGKGGKKPAGKAKKPTKTPVDAERRRNFSEQYMPYILGAVGFLTLVFFLVSVICAVAGVDHWMGPVGYGISYFFFGMFGWPAFSIPVLLLYLAVFWRRNCRENTVVLRCVLSVVLMLMVSAVVHVFVCAADDSFASIDIAEFFTKGAEYACGGVIGGVLGVLLYTGLKLWGTILVSILAFPLIIMFLVGVTPAYVGQWIKKKVAEAKEARALEEDDDEDEDEDEIIVPEKPKRKVKEANLDEDEEDVPATRPRKAVKPAATEPKRTRAAQDAEEIPETLRVDTRTGEVISDEEGDSAESLYVPAAAKRPARFGAAKEVAPSAPEKEKDMASVADKAVSAKATSSAEEAEDADALYVPPVPKRGERVPHKPTTAPASKQSAPVKSVADDFAADDLPEDLETMEINWDEETDEPASQVTVTAQSTVAEATPQNVPASEPEKIVVVVNRQETAAVTSTTDYHMDGLSDEEVVLSSATGEVVAEEEAREYAFPPIDLLIPGPKRYEADEEEIVRNTQTLRSVLESFHIRVKEIACSCGPTITRYEVKPDTGVRVRSIANLVDDIALGLAKSGVRIEAPIPGKAAVGIEVPNDHASTVALRNLIETPEFMNHKSKLAACLGADVAGRPVMMDINKMPHLLVAGTTGSGKSVCINSIIMSILYKAKPDEVKLILIDPKKVEFAVYRDLPHLYCPLISDPKKAAGALNSAVVEMERRFELIEEVGVRNIAGYNEATAGDPERPPLPQMVIIIDELADLMMTASNEVETAICRLAQKARAAGIHLILGTQRPSVDVITGLIKANVPSRIAFTVSAAVDSRTIIDTVGAEKLIGRGDMLYSPVGSTKPMRVQGTFVSDGEVEKVVTFLKEHNAQIEYDESFMHMIEVEAAKCGQGKKKGGDVGNIEDFSALGGDDEDGKFWAAVEVAVDAEKISTSLLQRRLNLGYGRAAKIIDRMEEMGFVGPADGNKPRKLLITKQDLAEIRISGRADDVGEE